MSGFEVVGVVLGVIPLVYKAFESYENIQRFVKLLKSDEDLLEFRTKFTMQKLLFRSYCYKMLARVEFDIPQMSDSAWKAPEPGERELAFDKELAEHLGEAYSICQSHVKSIGDILSKLGEYMTKLAPEAEDGSNVSERARSSWHKLTIPSMWYVSQARSGARSFGRDSGMLSSSRNSMSK